MNSYGKTTEGIFSRKKVGGERAEDAWNRLKFNHSFMNISYQRNDIFSCTSCLLRENVAEYEQRRGRVRVLFKTRLFDPFEDLTHIELR